MAHNPIERGPQTSRDRRIVAAAVEAYDGNTALVPKLYNDTFKPGDTEGFGGQSQVELSPKIKS